jgi:hypothetical protein
MAASLRGRDLAAHLVPGEKIVYDSNPNAVAALRRLRLRLLCFLLALPLLALVWPELAHDLLIYGGPCAIALYARSHLAGRRVLVTDQRLCHQASPSATWRSWSYGDIERITGIGTIDKRSFALTDRDQDRLWLRHLPRQAAFWQALPGGVKDSKGAGKELQFHRFSQDALIFSLLSLPLLLALFLLLPAALILTAEQDWGGHRTLFLWAAMLGGLALAGLCGIFFGLWASLRRHRRTTSRADAEELLAFAADPDVAGRFAWALRPFQPLCRMVFRWVY